MVVVNENIKKRALIRSFEREGTLLDQLTSLTSPSDYDTSYATHGIHPYPAKYIPQLPNLIIREHTDERNIVLDPFCGSGTSLLEATLMGRRSIGVDSNVVAQLISSAKTAVLSQTEIQEAIDFAEQVKSFRSPRKAFRPAGADELNLYHWFRPDVVTDLQHLKDAIDNKFRGRVALHSVMRCIFSSIIVSVSNQESETRYAAIEKDLPASEVFRRFSKKLEREIPGVLELANSASARRAPARVIHSDIRKISTMGIEENSIDLVVTSPPYPNSFDYYLYHKWRTFWLGHDYRDVMAAEIGSRNEHSSRKQPMAAYISKMRDAMIPIGRVLKPSKLAYFFVGDAVIGGEFFDISKVFQEILQGTDLRMIADSNYSLEKVTRSFHEKTSDNCHGGRRSFKKRQHILIFEKINRSRVAMNGARARASAKPESQQVQLSETVLTNGQVIALKSSDEQRHVHSIGRYPSKFIPEIPRWAIEKYSSKGATVMDPFGGSGTTAVEALLSGRNAICSDISPYSILLTRAKTCNVNSVGLAVAVENFVTEIKAGFPSGRVRFAKFELDDFWFPPGYLDDFASATNYIRTHIESQYHDILLAAVSMAVRPCSYQDESQIKVKRDPKKVIAGTPPPAAVISTMASRVLDRKLEFLKRLPSQLSARVITASADRLLNDGVAKKDAVDLIVTSPPYINAMNYPMTHRYENIVLGLLSPENKTKHEQEYFGSERVYAADYSIPRQVEWVFSRKQELNFALEKIYAGEPKRSFVAYRFFNLMRESLIQQFQCLKPDGHLVLVVGRNTIKGVPIDTFGFLVSIAEALGFSTELSFEYEIIKNAFKLTRHETADIIKTDGVAVLRKR